MTIRRVLKPFRFSLPASGEGRLPKEHIFAPGDVDIDDALLAHPWMQAGADGALEHHAATVARTKAAKDKADKAADDAARANKDAQAAMDRLVASHANTEEGRKAAHEQLNTPISELRAKQDGVNNISDPDMLKALNTPANQLTSTVGRTGEQSVEQTLGATPDGGSGLVGGPSTDGFIGAGEVQNAGAPAPELTAPETSTDEGVSTNAEGVKSPKTKGKK